MPIKFRKSLPANHALRGAARFFSCRQPKLASCYDGRHGLQDGMQNIPEGLFYWQWASNILNLGMSAAAALPIIMALTLLAARRGNARLCILGTQGLTRLTLGLGLLGPLLTAADLAATLISLGGSASLLNSLSLWDDAVLPYTTTVLAWIGGLCCLWIVAYMDGRSPLVAGLPDQEEPGPKGPGKDGPGKSASAAKSGAPAASKGRSARKVRRAPAPVEGSGTSDQLASAAMRGRLCLYLMAAVCFFGAQLLPNWSFSGPPQGLDLRGRGRAGGHSHPGAAAGLLPVQEDAHQPVFPVHDRIQGKLPDGGALPVPPPVPAPSLHRNYRHARPLRDGIPPVPAHVPVEDGEI